MREIKFRAWNENNMVYPSNEGHGKVTSGWILNNYSVVMQYTGLKDKNGVEIFEGDIMRTDFTDEIREVVFKDGGFCFKDKDGVFKHAQQYWTMSMEIIGNIHQNKELL